MRLKREREWGEMVGVGVRKVTVVKFDVRVLTVDFCKRGGARCQK